MLAKLKNYFDLAIAYFKLNLRSQLEYKGAFISQVLAMFINNCCWLAFWTIFFSRFPVLKGWEIKDVITMWAIVSAGFGLAHTIAGNSLFLPTLIAKGQLDTWMLYPRALLPHFILGKMSATACGDALFGFFAYITFVHPDLSHLLLFILLLISTTIFFIGFSILSGSLGFFLGNAEIISEQWRFSLITFSTYPAPLFEGNVKFLLLTLIPVVFASYLPVQALQTLSMIDSLYAFLGALTVLAVGTAVFYFGLKRYESGNLMEMRG